MLELNKIYNCDCLEIMKEIPDASIDCIVTDLPYGTTDLSFDKNPPDPQVYMPELLRIIKLHGAICVFTQLPFSCDVIATARKFFRYEWIYEKSNAVGFLNSHKMPLRAHENILVFYKSLPTYNPQFRQGKPYKKQMSEEFIKSQFERPDQVYRPKRKTAVTNNASGARYPRDVLYFKSPQVEFLDGTNKFQKSMHPTAKPQLLCEYLIKTYTNEGELVFDPFSGSGTSCAAAKATGRQYIGIEKDPKYYQTSIARCERIGKEPKNYRIEIECCDRSDRQTKLL